MPYIQIGDIETKVWPPDDAESIARLNNYRTSRLLFKGKHQDVYERVQAWMEKSQDKSIVYIVCNFAGLISKVSADMLFGEGIKYVAQENPVSKEQQQLDALIRSTRLNTLNYEMALSSSWRGEVIYKVRHGIAQEWKDDKPRPIIEPASPSCFWPILNGDNVRDLKGGVFGIVRTAPKGIVAQEGRKYLKLERHLPGTVYNELWLLDEDGTTIQRRVNLNLFPEYKDLEEMQETNYPGLLFTFVPNWRLEDMFWGISDYYDMDSIFDELNNRVSRISRVLDKHESPRLILPPGIMKLDESTGRWYIEKEDFEALEISGNDETVRGDLPRYLTWDAELEAAFKQIDKLLEMAFLVSETSPDAFGMSKEGGTAESGRALKFRLIRLLAKISRKKLYFDEAIKDVLTTAIHMDAEHGQGISPDQFDLRLQWSDGIPDDPYEMAQTEQLRTGGQATTSIQSAVRRLDNLEGEALKNEMQEIENDRVGQSNVPAFEAGPGRGGLDLFGQGNEEEEGAEE